MTEEVIDEGVERYRESARFSAAEKLALEYSERMATDPDTVDEAFYARLAEHFSTEEIVELGAFIGFNIGYHTFFGTLDFYPMFSPDGRLVEQEESRRIYGDTPGSLTRLHGAVGGAVHSAADSAADSAVDGTGVSTE